MLVVMYFYTGSKFFSLIPGTDAFAYMHLSPVTFSSMKLSDFRYFGSVTIDRTFVDRVSECNLGLQHHFNLLPYFYGNPYVRTKLFHLEANVSDHKKTEVKALRLSVEKAMREKYSRTDGRFAFDSDSTELLPMFENTFSKRLYSSLASLPHYRDRLVLHCSDSPNEGVRHMKSYLPVGIDLRVVPYRGFPDIILLTPLHNVIYIPHSIMELGHQQPTLESPSNLPEKLGEAIMAMMFMVMCTFYQDIARTQPLKAHGLFLHRTIGGIMIVLEVPINVLKVDDIMQKQPSVSLVPIISGVLLPDSLCFVLETFVKHVDSAI